MSSTPETPDAEKRHKDNAYQVDPENPADEKGYDTAKPNQADEGYTAEGILRHHGEKSKWGRTAEGDKGHHPDK